VDDDPLLRVDEGHDEHGTLLLRLRGELDMSTVPVLQARLQAASEANEPVVLDLAELDFVDSSGLRLFIAARLGRKQDGWSVALRNAGKTVRRTFAVAGLDPSLFFDD
jgi:anti-anti-sigma factor